MWQCIIAPAAKAHDSTAPFSQKTGRFALRADAGKTRAALNFNGATRSHWHFSQGFAR